MIEYSRAGFLLVDFFVDGRKLEQWIVNFNDGKLAHGRHRCLEARITTRATSVRLSAFDRKQTSTRGSWPASQAQLNDPTDRGSLSQRRSLGGPTNSRAAMDARDASRYSPTEKLKSPTEARGRRCVTVDSAAKSVGRTTEDCWEVEGGEGGGGCSRGPLGKPRGQRRRERGALSRRKRKKRLGSLYLEKCHP